MLAPATAHVIMRALGAIGGFVALLTRVQD